MTDRNPIPDRSATDPDPAPPAASLTRVAIKRRVMDIPAMAGPLPNAVPSSRTTASVPPSGSATGSAEPTPAKVFPSARNRADDSIAVTADTSPAIEIQEPSPPTVSPSAIIDLWEHLAANRLRPHMSDVDPVSIAGQWPNSLLLRVTEQGRRPAMEVAHMFAPTAGGPTAAIPIDAMTVDWIVGLSREVVQTGAPVHETDAVPTGEGPISCGVIALPFGPEAGVDHVLCHLYRVDDRTIEGDASTGLGLPPRDRTGIKRLFGR